MAGIHSEAYAQSKQAAGTVQLLNGGSAPRSGVGLAALLADADVSPSKSTLAPTEPFAGSFAAGAPGMQACPPLPASNRMLRVEVNGLLHDWFDVDEMGDFVKSPSFSSTLRENVARYFGVPLEKQAIYDEDGLLTTSADYSRALQRVHPKLFVYDVTEMNREFRDRTIEELEHIDQEVEQSFLHFGAHATRGRFPAAASNGAGAAKSGDRGDRADVASFSGSCGALAGVPAGAGGAAPCVEGSCAEGGSGGTGWVFAPEIPLAQGGTSSTSVALATDGASAASDIHRLASAAASEAAAAAPQSIGAASVPGSARLEMAQHPWPLTSRISEGATRAAGGGGDLRSSSASQPQAEPEQLPEQPPPSEQRRGPEQRPALEPQAAYPPQVHRPCQQPQQCQGQLGQQKPLQPLSQPQPQPQQLRPGQVAWQTHHAAPSQAQPAQHRDAAAQDFSLFAPAAGRSSSVSRLSVASATPTLGEGLVAGSSMMHRAGSSQRVEHLMPAPVGSGGGGLATSSSAGGVTSGTVSPAPPAFFQPPPRDGGVGPAGSVATVRPPSVLQVSPPQFYVVSPRHGDATPPSYGGAASAPRPPPWAASPGLPMALSGGAGGACMPVRPAAYISTGPFVAGGSVVRSATPPSRYEATFVVQPGIARDGSTPRLAHVGSVGGFDRSVSPARCAAMGRPLTPGAARSARRSSTPVPVSVSPLPAAPAPHASGAFTFAASTAPQAGAPMHQGGLQPDFGAAYRSTPPRKWSQHLGSASASPPPGPKLFQAPQPQVGWCGAGGCSASERAEEGASGWRNRASIGGAMPAQPAFPRRPVGDSPLAPLNLSGQPVPAQGCGSGGVGEWPRYSQGFAGGLAFRPSTDGGAHFREASGHGSGVRARTDGSTPRGVNC